MTVTVTQADSGTQVTVVGTEHALGSEQTTAGVYVPRFDLNALAVGDVIELYAKVKTIAGGTARTIRKGPFSQTQADAPIAALDPIPVGHSIQLYMKQTAGSACSVPWSLRRVGSFSQHSSGTQTTTGSEDTLATITDAGLYVLVLDLGAMVNGDAVYVSEKCNVLSAGTVRTFDLGYYEHVQTHPIIMSDPMENPSGHSIAFSIDRDTGTDRSYPWSILKG